MMVASCVVCNGLYTSSTRLAVIWYVYYGMTAIHDKVPDVTVATGDDDMHMGADHILDSIASSKLKGCLDLSK